MYWAAGCTMFKEPCNPLRGLDVWSGMALEQLDVSWT